MNQPAPAAGSVPAVFTCKTAATAHDVLRQSAPHLAGSFIYGRKDLGRVVVAVDVEGAIPVGDNQGRPNVSAGQVCRYAGIVSSMSRFGTC